MTAPPRRRRFSLDQHHRLGATGILGEDDRVEFIEGEIIEMSPIVVLHAGTVTRIQHVFSSRLADRAVEHRRDKGPLDGTSVSRPFRPPA